VGSARTFKLSTDPSFESKLRDVVGLYVNPPAAAAVFCFDEKTQVQALDRTQPSLPMVPGRAGTMTHDYKRNGTLDLFAALNVGSGEVLHDTRRSHTGRDVWRSSAGSDMHVDPDLELHVILDNLWAHKSQPVRDWLAHKKRRRWHLHFTPTSSSWLNLVECWFSVLSRKALTNTSFTSIAELETRIDCWVSHWNDNPEPFVWTKPADEILDKVARGQATLDRISKSATHHYEPAEWAWFGRFRWLCRFGSSRCWTRPGRLPGMCPQRHASDAQLDAATWCGTWSLTGRCTPSSPITASSCSPPSCSPT